MDIIANRIREIMDTYGISYGDVAEETGIAKSAVHRYVTGETKSIPADRLALIAKALYVTTDYLTGSGVFQRDYVKEFHLAGHRYTEEAKQEGYSIDWYAKEVIDSIEDSKVAEKYTDPHTYAYGFIDAIAKKPEDQEFVLNIPGKINHYGSHVRMPNIEPVTYVNTYGDICCGTGLFIDDNIIDTFTIPTSMLPSNNGEYFAQYAKGKSMKGAGINEGDLIIFMKTKELSVGQIGCFCVDEEKAVLRKFSRMANGTILLLPANDAFEPIQVDPMNNSFRIVGRMVAKIQKCE